MRARFADARSAKFPSNGISITVKGIVCIIHATKRTELFLLLRCPFTHAPIHPFIHPNELKFKVLNRVCKERLEVGLAEQLGNNNPLVDLESGMNLELLELLNVVRWKSYP